MYAIAMFHCAECGRGCSSARLLIGHMYLKDHMAIKTKAAPFRTLRDYCAANQAHVEGLLHSSAPPPPCAVCFEGAGVLVQAECGNTPICLLCAHSPRDLAQRVWVDAQFELAMLGLSAPQESAALPRRLPRAPELRFMAHAALSAPSRPAEAADPEALASSCECAD